MRTVHPRHLLVVSMVAALGLTACSTDETDGPTAPTAPTAPTGTSVVPSATDITAGTPSPTAAPSPSPTATPPSTTSPSPTSDEAAVPSLVGLCHVTAPSAGIEQAEFAVPEGWQVEDGNCEFFDPELDELEPATEPDNAVSVRIVEADFATVADPDGIDVETRHVGARSGFAAVRLAGGTSGPGIRPEGSPSQLFAVDLDTGTDEDAGTLVVTARSSSGASFDLATRAADRMVQTLRIVPPTGGDATVVTRVEGGGTPWAVTHDTADGCFQLRPGGPTDEPADEVCDVGTPDDVVTGAILSDGDVQVAAGLAPPLAARVEGDTGTATTGGVTTSLEGASAFAFAVETTPSDLHAVGIDGRMIATGTVGDS